LERQHPQMVVSDMKKSLRTGKVLVDWSQNDDHKTTVCVYSLRAKERPTASTPVKWEEVEHCLAKGDPSLLVFEAGEVVERAKKHGDLFAPVLKLKQKMPALEALQGMEAGTEAGPSGRKPKEKKATPGAVGGRAKPAAGKKAATTRKRG